uniref:Uncharacterized protein n=1 Tax=Tanacetum cinerariifolium TaxID=118510 RepID=A0A699S6T9_TANCI|nr:hypothetical protein [Tanacetum cinerariifolium]
MKNLMKHLNESQLMPLMMNLKKNLELNHLEKKNLMKNDRQNVSQQAAERERGMTGDLWLEEVISVKDSDTPDTLPSPTHGTPFTEITSSSQRSPVIPRS